MAPTTRTTQIGKQGATMTGDLERRTPGEVAPDWETAAAKAEGYQKACIEQIADRLRLINPQECRGEDPEDLMINEEGFELLHSAFRRFAKDGLTYKPLVFSLKQPNLLSAFRAKHREGIGVEATSEVLTGRPGTFLMRLNYTPATPHPKPDRPVKPFRNGVSLTGDFRWKDGLNPEATSSRLLSDASVLSFAKTGLSEAEQRDLVAAKWAERVAEDSRVQRWLAALAILAAAGQDDPNSKLYRAGTNANRWAGELLRAHYLTGSSQLDRPDQEREQESILLAPEEGRPERERYNAVFTDMTERIRGHPQVQHRPAPPEADARSAVLPEVTLDDDRRVSLSLHSSRHPGAGGSNDSISLQVAGSEKWLNQQIIGLTDEEFLALVPTEGEPTEDPRRDQLRQRIYDLFMNGRVGMHVLRRHDGSFALVPDAAIRQTTFADGGVGTDLVIPDTDPRFNPTLERLVRTLDQALAVLERQAQPSLLDMMAADAEQQAKEEQGPRASLIARWALRLLGIGQDDLEEVRAGRAGSSLGSHNNRALKPWWLGGRRG